MVAWGQPFTKGNTVSIAHRIKVCQGASGPPRDANREQPIACNMLVQAASCKSAHKGAGLGCR